VIPLALLPWLTKLKAMPWKLIGVVSLVVLAFIAGVRWEAAEFKSYKAVQAIKVAALEKKAAEITTVEVIKYVDRLQVIHEKGESIIKKVPVYVPRNVCVLPPGFRSLHDAAATGRDLPDSPGATDAPSTAPEDTAGKPR